MDSYIQNFKVNSVETHQTHNLNSCNLLFEVANTDDLKILHSNIRSISKNFDEFKILLSGLNYEFDIIVFTETWKVNCTSLFNLRGYKSIYNKREINQNDGAIIFYSERLNTCTKIVNLDNMRFPQIQ